VHPSAKKDLLSSFPELDDFFRDQIRELKEYDDSWAWGLCPFHDDRSPSFCVNFETGYYKCNSSSCGVSGVGIDSFVSTLHDVSREEAIRRIKEGAWI
jgi:DNA primase